MTTSQQGIDIIEASDLRANGLAERDVLNALAFAQAPSAANPFSTSTQALRLCDFVICVGDSITNSYAAYLRSRLPTHWKTLNGGIAGEITAQMLTRFAYTVRAGTAYVVILGGVNDVLGGVAAATIEANLQAMYTAAQAVGATVVAVTITPCKANALWSAGKQTVLDAVNAWILNTATDVDVRIDAYSVMENTPGDDLLKAAYDSGDGLHPNATGLTALATTIEQGVTWTPVSSVAYVAAGPIEVALNQSVRTTDDVAFKSMFASVADAPIIKANVIRPSANSTSAVRIFNAEISGDPVVNVDTTNKRLGILNSAPAYALDVNGQARVKVSGGGTIFYVASDSGNLALLALSQAGYESWFVGMAGASQTLKFYSSHKADVLLLNAITGQANFIQDVFTTTANCGLVLADRSNGHTYRIKVTAGVLGVEVVT